MSNLPSAGEWARVVDGCSCGGTDDCVGDVVLVKHITGSDWACECPICDQVFYGPVASAFGDKPGEGYPHHWLRKLPPDRQLLEEIEREAVPA